MLNAEQELVKKAKHDPAAFAELYDRYYPKILNYVVRRTANVSLAQDITSITFIKVLKKLQDYVPRDVPFSSWIYKIATNEIATYFRNKNNTWASLDRMMDQNGFEVADTYDVIGELEKAQEEVEKKEVYKKIYQQLITLDVKYQEVITLRFFEKKKIAEVALILGKPEGTVKSLLSRGITLLQSQAGATKKR